MNKYSVNRCGRFLLVLIMALVFPLKVFSAPKVSDQRQAFITYALSFQGRPYVHGAVGPNSFDCSGYIWYLAHNFSDYVHRNNLPESCLNGFPVNLPRISHDMYVSKDVVTFTDDSEREPGDLIFYKDLDNPGKIQHVGIYLGKSKAHGGKRVFISAVSAGPATGIVIRTIDEPYWAKRFMCYGRIVPRTKDAPKV